MAGNPKRREDLMRLATEHELGALILQRLEEGIQFARICEETGLSKAAITEWLDAPEQADRASRARARAADELVQQSLAIADEADDSSAAAVQKAKLRVSTRHWIAERWGREMYGQKGLEVNIELGQLHLDALRQRAADPEMVQDVTQKALATPHPDSQSEDQQAP